jgi:hypothetical protein
MRMRAGVAKHLCPMRSKGHGYCTTGRCYRVKGEPLVRLDGWCLVDATNVDDTKKELTHGQNFVSFMWHECESLKFEYRDEEDAQKECEIRYLDAEDSVVGKCWYCMERAPHDLHTIWTIHNMDIIREIPDPFQDSWEESYKNGRIEDIAESKKSAREAGWYNG